MLKVNPENPRTHGDRERAVFGELLERIGFAADTVNNGQEALAALEQHPYDIVLMDCQMPGLDGYNSTR